MTNRPRLLDLFCCAGGAAMGYYRAGFYVVGIDIKPQPHYPFEFHQADALEYVAQHGSEFDAIHASPPCQAYTFSTSQWRKVGREYPDLIKETRDALIKTVRPYVIENVPGSPLKNPVILNGGFFGMNIKRDRLFETSFDMPLILINPQMPAVKMGRPASGNDVVLPVGHFSSVAYVRRQMDINWMSVAELAQAIPPAYTEFIGSYLLQAIKLQK